jgi:hypothetical protein
MKQFVLANLWELIAAAGGLLITAGLALVYPPAALIFAGVAMLTLGIWGAKQWASSSPRSGNR